MEKAIKISQVNIMKEARVDYDTEEDILYITTGIKVRDSVEFDQFIIDFSADDKIVGIEIMDASKYLKNFLETEIDKERLQEIKSAKFSVIQQKEFAIIKFVMNVPMAKGIMQEQVITATAPVAMMA